MSGTLSFNGFDVTETLGLKIGGVQTYAASWHDAPFVTVPGRVGQVLVDSSVVDLPNEIREYTAALYLRSAKPTAVARAMASIRDYLMRDTTMYEIYDSYEPEFYRLGVWYGQFSPTRKGAGSNFEIPLRFSCDPRRFIAGNYNVTMQKNGALSAAISASSITNFSLSELARPVIYVTGGNSAFELAFKKPVSGVTTEYGRIKFNAFDGSIYINADSMSASVDPYGYVNANDKIQDVTGDIYLDPSVTTTVTRTNASAMVRISPRWWVR